MFLQLYHPTKRTFVILEKAIALSSPSGKFAIYEKWVNSGAKNERGGKETVVRERGGRKGGDLRGGRTMSALIEEMPDLGYFAELDANINRMEPSAWGTEQI